MLDVIAALNSNCVLFAIVSGEALLEIGNDDVTEDS